MSALFGPTPVNCGNDYPHLRYGWCILFRHPTRCRRGRHRNCNLVIRREAQARRAARRYAPDILLLEEYRPFYKMKTEQAREVFNPGLKRNLRFNQSQLVVLSYPKHLLKLLSHFIQLWLSSLGVNITLQISLRIVYCTVL